MFGLTNNFIKNDFISNYGDYSEDFSLVSSDGSMHWSVIVYFILAIIAFTAGIGIYNKSKDENIKENKKNIYKYLGYGLLGFGGLILLLTIIKFISYQIQWTKWYKELPSNGRSDYNKMKLIKGLSDQLRNTKSSRRF